MLDSPQHREGLERMHLIPQGNNPHFFVPTQLEASQAINREQAAGEAVGALREQLDQSLRRLADAQDAAMEKTRCDTCILYVATSVLNRALFEHIDVKCLLDLTQDKAGFSSEARRLFLALVAVKRVLTSCKMLPFSRCRTSELCVTFLRVTLLSAKSRHSKLAFRRER